MIYRSPQALKHLLLAGLLVACATSSKAGTLTWNVTSGTWDTTTPNWTGTSTTFTDGGVDDVTFSNTAGGTVSITDGVSPLSILVNAASGIYTFQNSNGGAANANPAIDSGSLTKSGAGTLIMTGINSYTGVTTVNAGVLSVGGTVGLGTGGTNGALGASSNAASNLVLNGGTLSSNSANGSTDRLFTVGGSAVTIQAAQATSFTNTGAIAYSAGFANLASTITLSCGNVAYSFAPQITNNGTGVVNLTVSNGNVATVLSNTSSSYTGVTTFTTGNGATVEVKKLANGGSASSIGASTNVATNFVVNGGTIVRYTGVGDSSDRNYRITGNGNKNMTWDASGTGALVLSGAAVYAGLGPGGSSITFTLTGSSAANLQNAYNGIIGDNPNGATPGNVPLVKSGSNTWILGGNNTYLGTTSVNVGTLLINGNQSTATGNVTVAASATLGGSGTIGGATTVSNTGILNPGNTMGLLTFSNSLTFAGTDSKVNFDLATGTRGINFDGINVGGALAYNGDLTLTIAGMIANGTYNLFTFGSQGGNLDTLVFGGAGPYAGSFTNSGGTWTATSNGQSFTFTQGNGNLVVGAVPEPATAVFTLGGCGLLLLLGRKGRFSGQRQG